jgi:drug/metabolite transporter (DMT)-like permease
MIYILLSILCSVIVSVMLKLAKRYSIDVKQAITWNYSIAMLLTWIVYRPQLNGLEQAPWSIYISLGILLPIIFWAIAASVEHTGIVRTDVAQRLSLFIPLTAAFFLFGENLSLVKSIGIVLGFVAIAFSIPTGSKQQKSSSSWFYPLVVFAGMGIIDVLFKQIALFKGVSYTSSLFVVYALAFVVSLLLLAYLFMSKASKFSWINMLCGWILGVFNFGNILFYLKAHQAEAARPSLVFTAMNIGVIALGSLVGLLIFKEKLSLLNKMAIVVAVAAILVISFA